MKDAGATTLRPFLGQGVESADKRGRRLRLTAVDERQRLPLRIRGRRNLTRRHLSRKLALPGPCLGLRLVVLGVLRAQELLLKLGRTRTLLLQRVLGLGNGLRPALALDFQGPKKNFGLSRIPLTLL